MLVKELKDVISKYSKEEKDKIIIELYKRIPKSKKEDYDIDNYILNIKQKEKINKKDEKLSFEVLEKEVNFFLECANNDLYASSNSIVSKTERSKWRFKVKNFCKQLNSFPPDSKEGEKATDLLRDLFILLSHATHYLTFSNWETFRAIQISQSSFLGMIIKRKLQTGVTKENLKYCVKLLHVKFDPYSYHLDLLCEFISCLKTVDMEYMAIELLKDEVSEMLEKLKKLQKGETKYYRLSEHCNYFIECIFIIYSKLYEVEPGIKYFQKFYIEKDPEVKEYILLDLIESFATISDWLREYERNINKIDYREYLQEKYESLKNA